MSLNGLASDITSFSGPQVMQVSLCLLKGGHQREIQLKPAHVYRLSPVTRLGVERRTETTNKESSSHRHRQRVWEHRYLVSNGRTFPNTHPSNLE